MTKASEVSCENVLEVDWGTPIGQAKTCVIHESTTIDAEGFTITPKDETMGALDFHANKKVKFLPTGVSESLPNLLLYDARKCSLTTISKTHFKDLNKLKVLNLYGNQISTINSDTFEDLIALEILWLRKKFIFIFSNYSFISISQATTK